MPADFARSSGFTKRQSKLSAADFVQLLVGGWVANAQASLAELVAADLPSNVQITAQALDQRFTAEAAALLQAVLGQAVHLLVSSQPVAIPLLNRCTGVYVRDSSTITLPASLVEQWRGAGNGSANSSKSAVKVAVALNLQDGSLYGPLLEDAVTHDSHSAVQQQVLPKGALTIGELGYFTVRRFGRKLLTMPQKDKVLKHLQSIKSYLSEHQQTKTGQVIHDLNPVIRGWANYYRHSAAKKTYSVVRHRQWQMLWRWAKRRHPNKSARWVRHRYFQYDSYWTFHDGNAELVKPDATPITRFTKVTGRNSPYDPTLRTYWQERVKRTVARQTYSKRKLALLKEQEYRCTMCHILFSNTDEMDVHHDTPRNAGGKDDLQNLRAVHRWCQHQHHQRSGYKVHKA